MNIDAAREALARAADALRTAHGEVLGALQSKLEQQDREGKLARVQLEASATRDQLIARTRASNMVMAAHNRIRNNVFGLTVGRDQTDLLRVADVVDVGTLLINAKRAGIHAELDVPLLIPLIGAGNLTIVGAGEKVVSLIRTVQTEALRETTAGQLSLIAYDPDLLNPIAPFARLSDAGSGMVRTVQSAKELDSLVEELSATVARVGNLLLGGPVGLVEQNALAGKQFERYYLVCFYNYPTSVTEQQHTRILALSRAAARHGIAFIFHVPDKNAVPAWLNVKELRSTGESFDMTASRVLWLRKPDLTVSVHQTSPAEATAAVGVIVDLVAKSSKVELSTLLPGKEWTESSREGLTVLLAQGASGPIVITFGDDMPHGLITGGSGSGKSNLIKLLIYSLAARYSPDELELYLLDMKEGVTLARMAPSTGNPVYLPHARVIGLQADQEYGLSVLQEIEKTFKRRMSEMSPFDNIKEYRKAHPDARMPRILLVIDELHLLLAPDANRVGQEAAAKLLSLVKLVRAAGIHIVVATQEMGSVVALAGNAREGLLGQIKLRVALRNTAIGSEQTLSIGNKVASELRERGQVVVNSQLGAIDANRVGGTPFADELLLSGFRERWYENRPAVLPDLAVFDGKPPADLLLDICAVAQAAAAVARAEASPRAFLGRPVAVSRTPLSFAFEQSPGRNLAIVGAPADGNDDFESADTTINHLALGPIAAAGLSLATQHPPQTVEFVVLDLLSLQDCRTGILAVWLDALRELGHSVTVIAQTDVKRWILESAAALPARTPASKPIYVFGLGFDRVAPIMEREGGIGTVAVVKHLQAIWQNGPTTGMHSVFWWGQGATYLQHIDKKMDSYFTGTMVLFGAEEVAQRVNDLGTKWQGAENRGLYRDSSGSQGKRKVIPYRALDAIDIRRFFGEVYK